MDEGLLTAVRPSKPPMALSSASVVSSGFDGVSGMWRFDQHGCRTVTSAPVAVAVTRAMSQRGSVQKPLPSENSSSTLARFFQEAIDESVVEYPSAVWCQTPGRAPVARVARCAFTYSSRLRVPGGTLADHTLRSASWTDQPVTAMPPERTGCAPGAAR